MDDHSYNALVEPSSLVSGEPEVRLVQFQTTDPYERWLLEEYFRLRYQMYCEANRWEPPNSAGKEVDEFDDGRSEYHILVQDGQVEAGCRVIRKNGFSLPLEKFYDGPIYAWAVEISRMVSRGCNINFLCTLYTALFKHLRSPAVQNEVFAVILVRYLRKLKRLGLDIRVLPTGKAKVIGEERFVPVIIDVYNLPWLDEPVRIGDEW